MVLTTIDTRKFTLAVSQTYEAIEASANWVNRDQKDVEQVSFEKRFIVAVQADHPVAQGQQVQRCFRRIRRPWQAVHMSDPRPDRRACQSNVVEVKRRKHARMWFCLAKAGDNSTTS